MAVTSTSSTVHVEGLDALLRSMRRTEGKLAPQLRKAMKDRIGKPFVQDVKGRISSVGLVDSGRLRNSIKASMTGSTLVVRSTPPLNPGPRSRAGYAPIYEFGHGGARSFMRPELDEWRRSGKTERAFSEYLDWVENEWGRG